MSGIKGHGGKKGRSGRPRLPSAVKKLHGSYRPSTAAKNEVKVTLGRPDMPDWLDEEARAEWERVTPMLEKARVLAPADKAMLADYCSAHSLAVNATKAYLKAGLLPKQKKNSLVILRAHPMIAVAQKARAEAHRLGTEFGLSPASRSRVSAQPGDDDGKNKDDAEAFIFGPPKLVVG